MAHPRNLSTQAARALILRVLSDGTWLPEPVVREVITQAGFTAKDLENARLALAKDGRLEVQRVGGSAGDGSWVWYDPDAWGEKVRREAIKDESRRDWDQWNAWLDSPRGRLYLQRRRQASPTE
jgi:hypothetical protein